MARLAIRATGDRSKRENVTTGDNVVETNVYYKNKRILFVNYNIQHDTLHINVGDDKYNYLCKSIVLEDNSETHSA